MKKLVLLATTAFILGMAAPSFAASADVSDSQAVDIQSDAGAIHKDNVAIQHDNENIEANRASKAKAKANGDVAAQAANSVKIGANKTARSEKKTEKDVDQHILQQDEKPQQ